MEADLHVNAPCTHTLWERCLSLGLMTPDCPPLFVQFTTKDCVVISIICGSYTRAQIQCDLRVDFDLIGRASGVLTKPELNL
jgi:hypothetical protein